MQPFFNSTRASMMFCPTRSEEHTSELQSQSNLVCRLLLEKKSVMLRRVLQRGPSRTVALLVLLLAVLCAAPWLANDYLLTVLITILYFAYDGQAWNVMMGC